MKMSEAERGLMLRYYERKVERNILPNNMRIPVCIYARKSQEDIKDNSIDMQINECKRFIEENNEYLRKFSGYQLVLMNEADIFFEDAHSGMFEDLRPALEQLKKEVKKNKYCACIVLKNDRIGRRKEVYNSIRYQFDTHGCLLISTIERDEMNAVSTLNRGMMMEISEYHARNSAELSSLGMRNCVRNGRNVGLLPFGLRSDEKKRIVVDENEAPAIRLMFELTMNGQSLEEVANALNMRGYRTRKGQEFTRFNISQMLRNVKYKGTYLYCDNSRELTPKRANHRVLQGTREEIRIDNAFEAIVEPAVFDKVQEMLGEKRKTHYYSATVVDYLLSSTIECAYCHKNMHGNLVRVNKKGDKYCVYQCENHRKKLTDCPTKPIKIELIEGVVKQIITRIVNSIFEQYPDYMLISTMERRDELAKDIERTKRSIASNESSIRNLARKISMNVSLYDIFEAEMLSMKDSIEHYKVRLLELSYSMESIEKELANAKNKPYIIDEETLFSNKGIARRLVTTFIDKIEYDNDNIKIILK